MSFISCQYYPKVKSVRVRSNATYSGHSLLIIGQISIFFFYVLLPVCRSYKMLQSLTRSKASFNKVKDYLDIFFNIVSGFQKNSILYHQTFLLPRLFIAFTLLISHKSYYISLLKTLFRFPSFRFDFSRLLWLMTISMLNQYINDCLVHPGLL